MAIRFFDMFAGIGGFRSGLEAVDGFIPDDFLAIMNYANHQLVEIAKFQLGNVGGEPYWSWYGFSDRVEWCACFVSWCARVGETQLYQCGYIDRGVIPKFAGCGIGVDWFKNKSRWLDGSSDHVGIVEKVEGRRVYTIEGKSGDACQRNSYPVGYSSILGYGTPNFIMTRSKSL